LHTGTAIKVILLKKLVDKNRRAELPKRCLENLIKSRAIAILLALGLPHAILIGQSDKFAEDMQKLAVASGLPPL
jgi:hypothetical protein